MSGGVIALALLLGPQVLSDHVRADQAADMSGQNPVGAAVHGGMSLLKVFLGAFCVSPSG
jgi:hypothetical protein